jgi:general stress protein YciG
MAGTKEGGKKAALTNKSLYGLGYYKEIGRKGGRISRGGGFAANLELAKEAGRKGGSAPRHIKRPVAAP